MRLVSHPHGRHLISRIASSKKRERILSEAKELLSLDIDEGKAYDVENIAYGIYSPIEGFMVQEELNSVLEDMRLSNDLPWGLPILLDQPQTCEPKEGEDVLLTCRHKPIALFHVEELYRYDTDSLAFKTFKTTSPDHPGVVRVSSMTDTLIGGKIEFIEDPPNRFEKYTLRPKETRLLFSERGWKTIVGFQTRNIPHIGHEYLQKSALVFIDGLFINPVIGKKKGGDFQDDVILEAYDALIKDYYPWNSVALSILRYEMRYAGPREALHHAIMRKNFGCTHFIVGRDHAGVGNHYRPYEAQEIFSDFTDLGITPLFFKEFFHCKKCNGIVNSKVCPHNDEYKVSFSGTKIRQLIMEGKRLPEEFIRPEVAETIQKFHDPFV